MCSEYVYLFLESKISLIFAGMVAGSVLFSFVSFVGGRS